MTGKMSPRLLSICGVTLAVCMLGVFSFTQFAPENHSGGNRNHSAAYAKQITRDLSPLPNQNSRLRIVISLRNFDSDHGIEPPMYLPEFPISHAINQFDLELPLSQSLAILNPTTRSPPA